MLCADGTFTDGTFAQCWYNAGALSTTLGQHCINIGWSSRICRAATGLIYISCLLTGNNACQIFTPQNDLIYPVRYTVDGIFFLIFLFLAAETGEAPVAETGFSHRLTAYKIVGHFFGLSYREISLINLVEIVFLESITFQLHARMLSSEVAQSLKNYGHFSDLGVGIALSHRHGEFFG